MKSVKRTRFLMKMERRAADIEYRKTLGTRRIVHDRQAEVDEKAEQLKAIAEISTVLAGFTMASLVNMDFNGTRDVLLIFYSVCCASTICLLLLAAVISSYLLMCVYKFDIHTTLDRRFEEYWGRFREEWKYCFHCLVGGVFLFVIVFIELSWISGVGHFKGTYVSITVTVGIIVLAFLWATNVYYKWYGFLEDGLSRYVPSSAYRRNHADAAADDDAICSDND